MDRGDRSMFVDFSGLVSVIPCRSFASFSMFQS
jgi:hypothetical protein